MSLVDTLPATRVVGLLLLLLLHAAEKRANDGEGRDVKCGDGFFAFAPVKLIFLLKGDFVVDDVEAMNVIRGMRKRICMYGGDDN